MTQQQADIFISQTQYSWDTRSKTSMWSITECADTFMKIQTAVMQRTTMQSDARIVHLKRGRQALKWVEGDGVGGAVPHAPTRWRSRLKQGAGPPPSPGPRGTRTRSQHVDTSDRIWFHFRWDWRISDLGGIYVLSPAAQKQTTTPHKCRHLVSDQTTERNI